MCKDPSHFVLWIINNTNEQANGQTNKHLDGRTTQKLYPSAIMVEADKKIWMRLKKNPRIRKFSHLLWIGCVILSQTTNFILFQTEKFADDNFKFDENGKTFSKWVKNTMGKGLID